MNLMMCMTGEPEQIPFLPEIAQLGAGIELGSYGLVGIRSDQLWEARVELHQTIRNRFHGTVAIHGPFIGMEYGHIDHVIRDAVNRRLDMTLATAVKLGATRVVLHSGYSPEVDLCELQDSWFMTSITFWRGEIGRWADAGIEIVLENDTEKSPDALVRVVEEVDNPFLGLCLDIGHVHIFSELDAIEWVRRIARRLVHIQLHDNDGTADSHWSIGRGTIDFEQFYAALEQHVPHATLALESVDDMEAKMVDLRKLVARFTAGRHAQ